MIERGRAVAGRMLGTHWTAAAAIFALLAIVHTWPLAREPGVRDEDAGIRLAL